MKFTLEGGGYEYMLDSRQQYPDKVAIHQLVAIADGADPYKVFSDEWHVHHIDGNKWNNSVNNLELKSAEDHATDHMVKSRGIDLPIDKVVDLYESGHTSRQIADIFDCSQPVVLETLRETNVSIRNNSTRWEDKPWADKELLKSKLDEGLTQSEIADEFGCSDATISKRLDRFEIER